MQLDINEDALRSIRTLNLDGNFSLDKDQVNVLTRAFPYLQKLTLRDRPLEIQTVLE